MALKNSSIMSMNTFLNNIFFIPNYQREYSWEEAQLEDFWDDLENTRNDTELNHFFGQIVIHNNEERKRKYIIDGQQRTITSTIFMRALQIFYEKIYEESKIDDAKYHDSDITSIYIGRFTSSKNDLHLRLGELDEEYFREKIQRGYPQLQKESKKSHERLRRAYCFFQRKFSEKLDNEKLDIEDKLELLNEFYSTFIDRFQVLYMEATELEEAFIIFETLNARGRELETADLLKNFIFSKSKDVNLAQKKWNAMLNALDKADSTKYIRHFWNSQGKFAREKELYRVISKQISNPRKSDAFLENLSKYADCYHDIAFPDDNNNFNDEGLVNSLKALSTLKASSFYPVILAMKQTDGLASEDAIKEVVETIESYVFRNFTICGKVANRSERFFAEVAEQIYDGNYDTTELICKQIQAEMVDDAEFSSFFLSWTGSKSTKETIRYILRKIHTCLDPYSEVSFDNSAVHVEHIMPEDNKIWKVPEEIHDTFLWRLGNLALLSGKKNIAASNKAFDEKKAMYRESKIEPNKEIAENMQWTEKEIEARQQRLCNEALKIWEK